MAASWLKRKNLLVMMACLLVVKFFVMPILGWQSANIEKYSAKYRQLEKLNGIVSQQSGYEEMLRRLEQQLLTSVSLMYTDNQSAELTIQKDVEDVFTRNGLDISTFNWVIDTPGDVRVLRAKIFFSGHNQQIIKTMWDLSMLPKIVRQLSWHYHISYLAADQIGKTNGNLTLEFYAVADWR